jgi:hypothetical protein
VFKLKVNRGHFNNNIRLLNIRATIIKREKEKEKSISFNNLIKIFKVRLEKENNIAPLLALGFKA